MSLPVSSCSDQEDLQDARSPAKVQLSSSRSSSGTASCNKPRLRWTPELHERFVDAVNKLEGPESRVITLVHWEEFDLEKIKPSFYVLFDTSCRGNSQGCSEAYEGRGLDHLSYKEPLTGALVKFFWSIVKLFHIKSLFIMVKTLLVTMQKYRLAKYLPETKEGKAIKPKRKFKYLRKYEIISFVGNY